MDKIKKDRHKLFFVSIERRKGELKVNGVLRRDFRKSEKHERGGRM